MTDTLSDIIARLGDCPECTTYLDGMQAISDNREWKEIGAEYVANLADAALLELAEKLDYQADTMKGWRQRAEAAEALASAWRKMAEGYRAGVWQSEAEVEKLRSEAELAELRVDFHIQVDLTRLDEAEVEHKEFNFECPGCGALAVLSFDLFPLDSESDG